MHRPLTTVNPWNIPFQKVKRQYSKYKTKKKHNHIRRVFQFRSKLCVCVFLSLTHTHITRRSACNVVVFLFPKSKFVIVSTAKFQNTHNSHQIEANNMQSLCANWRCVQISLVWMFLTHRGALFSSLLSPVSFFCAMHSDCIEQQATYARQQSIRCRIVVVFLRLIWFMRTKKVNQTAEFIEIGYDNNNSNNSSSRKTQNDPNELAGCLRHLCRSSCLFDIMFSIVIQINRMEIVKWCDMREETFLKKPCHMQMFSCIFSHFTKRKSKLPSAAVQLS